MFVRVYLSYDIYQFDKLLVFVSPNTNFVSIDLYLFFCFLCFLCFSKRCKIYISFLLLQKYKDKKVTNLLSINLLLDLTLLMCYIFNNILFLFLKYSENLSWRFN